MSESKARAFHNERIEGVIVRPLRKFVDERGWLCELWREDQLGEAPRPAMTYVSQTEPGVVRGPHEHVDQTDYFCFLGPSNFKVYLWDNRADSRTYNARQVTVVGADAPTIVVIPPGVAHAYRNVGHAPGIVFNAPDALYRGRDYADEVDEIRHEDDPDSPFVLD